MKKLLSSLIAWAYNVPVCPKCRQYSPNGDPHLACSLQRATEAHAARTWHDLEGQWLVRDQLPDAPTEDSSAIRMTLRPTRRVMLQNLDTEFNSDAHK